MLSAQSSVAISPHRPPIAALFDLADPAERIAIRVSGSFSSEASLKEINLRSGSRFYREAWAALRCGGSFSGAVCAATTEFADAQAEAGAIVRPAARALA